MKKGFTLIELLVVIAIIGLLTAIITANLVQSKSKSRDGKRISDISQIQLAVELYGDRCNQYPAVSGSLPNIDDGTGCPSGVFLSTFISQLPLAPAGGGYTYAINGSATDYVLSAQLENDSTLDRFTGTRLGVTCSGTKIYCVVPR